MTDRLHFPVNCTYSSPESFVKRRGFVRKVSCGNAFHNPDRIAISICLISGLPNSLRLEDSNPGKNLQGLFKLILGILPLPIALIIILDRSWLSYKMRRCPLPTVK